MHNKERFASIRVKNWGVSMGSLALLEPLGPLEPLGYLGPLRPRDPLDPGIPETPSSSGPEMGVVASFCVSN